MDSVRPGIGETGFVQHSAAPHGAGPGGQARQGSAPDAQPDAEHGPQSRALRGAIAAGPGLADADMAALDGVASLLRRHPAALLTGAGLSTDSGIPDYRGPNSPPRQPLTYQEFMADPQLRQRYWARNHVGWAHMHQAEPNAGHLAAAALRESGHLTGIITQNVDGLHGDADTPDVVDLHGRFDRVVCMGCTNTYSRAFIAIILTELNPGFLAAVTTAGGVSAAPDADADLESEKLIAGFKVAKCPLCGGLLKPDFVFFGENVPKDRVARSFELVDAAGFLIVAGSSLAVMSGLRFVKKANKDGKSVVIINRGETRGDPFADVRLEAGVGESLGYLADVLGLDWRNH
ncbi:Sir2 family NAD-dependent protein deacetylase [Specibacter sp. AOP5-B1-6]|uniref:Sir2 family NAD-dependent protein deacetylase n=1 Tax=Specibacter sp. AOP5-B1-6 TaxID=3457653 RepID=UPI003FB8F3C5